MDDLHQPESRFPPRIIAPNSQRELELDLIFPPNCQTDQVQISILPIPAAAGIRETGSIFEVPYTRLDLPNGCCRILQHQRVAGCSPTHLNISLFDQLGGAKRLDIPTLIHDRLLEYIIKGPPDSLGYPFDCTAFGHYLNDVKYFPGLMRPRDWQSEEITKRSSCEPGVTITMGTPVENPFEHLSELKFDPTFHMAVSLGEGYFISKLGYGGGLMVSQLLPMFEGFRATKIWQHTPNKSLKL